MCKAWNKASASHPEIWPQVRLDPGDRRQVYALPDERIDAAFCLDMERMLACFSSPLGHPEEFRKEFARGTIDELRRILKRLYTIGVTHHRPTPTITCLADLVRVDVVTSILDYYLTRFGSENKKSAGKYAQCLYFVAKYWVCASDDHLAVLRKYRKNLTPRRFGMTDNVRAMLRLFDEERIGRLLGLGAVALTTFSRIRNPSLRDLLELQIACAIEILIAAPVRPQNLASICLSRHLVWGREGNGETLHLVFPAAEVKNDIDMEFRLPRRVINILKVYLANRKMLLATDHNEYLFPGRGLRHKRQSHLSQQIARMAEDVIGVRVTGHRFRHLVGFLYLKDNPGGHEVVRRFLGHKRIETTINFYAGMEQAAAVALWDQHLEILHQRLARQPAKRPGKARQRSQARSKAPGSEEAQ